MLVTDPLDPCSERPGAIGIISSAGGIPALFEMLGTFPATFPWPIFISQHLPRGATSVLAELLNNRCGLQVEWASDGDMPRPGRIYVVKPGDTARIERSGMRISAQEQHWRSWLESADALFTGIADTYREMAIGVVLSGMMPVGVEGLRSIRRAGGLIMAQSKATSLCFDMPAAACDFAKAEVLLSPSKIAAAICVVAEAWTRGRPTDAEPPDRPAVQR